MVKYFYALIIGLLLSVGSLLSQTFNWDDLQAKYLVNDNVVFEFYEPVGGNYNYQIIDLNNSVLCTFNKPLMGKNSLEFTFFEEHDSLRIIKILENEIQSESPYFDITYGLVNIITPELTSELNYQEYFELNIETENPNILLYAFFRYTDGREFHVHTFNPGEPKSKVLLISKYTDTLEILVKADNNILASVGPVPVGIVGLDSIVANLREELKDFDRRQFLLDSILTERDSVTIPTLQRRITLLEDSITNFKPVIVHDTLHFIVTDPLVSSVEYKFIDGKSEPGWRELYFTIVKQNDEDVSFRRGAFKSDYTIFDITGKIVKTGYDFGFIPQEYDLQSGIYFIYLRSNTNYGIPELIKLNYTE